MRRRLTTCVLAAFYLLQATWLLHSGVDLLFPRIRVVAVGADACCTSSCGCPEEARARNACCCVNGGKDTAHQTAPRPVSSIEEARCKGVEAAMTQAFTQPVVCVVACISLPEITHDDLPVPDLHPLLSPTSEALDKVPIAQA